MSLRFHHYVGCALSLLALGQLSSSAEDTAKSRPTPIIFSAPRSDTVSSNLNQIGTKSSPLTDLESGLKKPFEIFDAGRSSGDFAPANRFVPQSPSSPTLNNKKLKDVLDKRAEDSYLLRENDELSQDDLLKSDGDPFDPAGKRPKTSLDRYYDRIDRMRGGPTNQTANSLDLFGEKNDLDERDDSRSRKSEGLFNNERSGNARVLGGKSNNISEGGRLSSDKLKSRSFGDIFELGPVAPAESKPRIKDTRLDEFKRLLDGPGYGARNEFNVAPPATASPGYQPPKSSIAPSSTFANPQPAGGVYANTPGFSGAVGVPVGVPEYAASSPSLTPTPPVQEATPKLPVPSVNIPRRRF